MLRRIAVVPAVIVALLVPALAGAGAAQAGEPATTVKKPRGAAPLRYRDPVIDRVKVTRGIHYRTAPGANGEPVRLTLDLFEPVGDRKRGRPAAVWIHGGGFVSGNSRNARMVTMATEFAKRGYVTVSINYRLIRDANAAQQDAEAAVRWLQRRARRLRIDRDRIGIGGSSAGGITAMLVGVRSPRVKGVVSISGALPVELGVDRRDAPTLFFHGTADLTVPYDWATINAREFANARVPVVLETFQGGGHVPFEPNRRQIVTHSAWWLYDALELGR